MPGIVSVILTKIANRFDIEDSTFKIGDNIFVEFLNQFRRPLNHVLVGICHLTNVSLIINSVSTLAIFCPNLLKCDLLHSKMKNTAEYLEMDDR